MALFTIADLHLSLGSDKPMDVFRGWDNYVERLEKNWRAIVNQDDTVVIAGDISWGMSMEESRKDFEFIDSLPGRKIILKGNHDYWWSTRSKIDTFLTENGLSTISVLHNDSYLVDDRVICGTRGWLYNAETDNDIKIVNREVGRLNASLDHAEKNYPDKEIIVFLHYPPVYGDMCSEPILEAIQSRNIKQCYFGHIHGSDASKRAIHGQWEDIKMTLISADYIKFVPYLIR